jgi:hypothetical protein
MILNSSTNADSLSLMRVWSPTGGAALSLKVDKVTGYQIVPGDSLDIIGAKIQVFAPIPTQFYFRFLSTITTN